MIDEFRDSDFDLEELKAQLKSCEDKNVISAIEQYRENRSKVSFYKCLTTKKILYINVHKDKLKFFKSCRINFNVIVNYLQLQIYYFLECK